MFSQHCQSVSICDLELHQSTSFFIRINLRIWDTIGFQFNPAKAGQIHPPEAKKKLHF